MTELSSIRARLASFDHAYAVALQCRRQSGIPHYVVHGETPLQAYRVTTCAPELPDRWLAMVV